MSRERQKEIAAGAVAGRREAPKAKEAPAYLRSKGSFLVRQFSSPKGPLINASGKSTRLALSASEWGEAVPKNVHAARKLAKKGEALLARLKREAKKIGSS